MKKTILSLLVLCASLSVSAHDFTISSPDGQLKMNVSLVDKSLQYNVSYKGITVLENSPLGMVTNVSDFSKNLTFVDKNDKVKYFSQSADRIFTRSRAIINRDVRHCHPPSSVHIVEKILEDFK